MVKLIYIVDDEPDIVELLAVNLEKYGFKVRSFLTGNTFIEAMNEQKPDLVVLDIMLPDRDGMDICKELRQSMQFAHIPIIMLTARVDEADKIVGLELGADDYVTKPFSPRELVARIKAVLRRANKTTESAILKIGDILVIDLDRYEVLVHGEKTEITSTEFRILELLVRNKGWVFSRQQILDHLWGNEKIVLDRTVDVHIKNLREKLGPAKSLIKNIRGVGYKLDEK